MTDKLELLQRWETHYNQTEAAYELMRAAFNVDPEAPAVEPMWRLFDDYTNLVAEMVGDEDGWLGWYHCENDFGKKGLSAKASRWERARPIKNVKMLLKLIEDCEDSIDK